MNFSYLCGVGRSGSTWLSEFLRWVSGPSVCVVHYGLAQRTAGVGSGTLDKFLSLYLERLQSVRSTKAFVECEGTWLDRIAMHYGLPDAVDVVDALPVNEPRGALLTRHPFGYVASVKASGWLGGWWKRPSAHRLAGMVDDFESRSIVEQAALSWQLRNEWFYGLVDVDRAGVLTYEELLGKDVDEHAYRDSVEWMLDLFGIEPVKPRELWQGRRDVRVRPHNKRRVELDDTEKDVVRDICAPMMERLGYE